jgi:CRP-like cAMP-binding protein
MSTNFFKYSATTEAADRNKSILRNLTDVDWDKVLSFAALRSYPSAAVITAVDDDQHALYFVVTGVVRVQAASGNEVKQQTFAEGNVFGILPFLDGEPNGQITVAEGDVEIMVLTPQAFEQMASWYPRIAIMLLRDLGADVASRLRRFDASV